MPVDIILGLQWGDEGKGKLVDLLTDDYDLIVRYQGGDNAGHTVVRDGKTLKFHLIPSGITTPGRLAVIGNGVVINFASIISEFEKLTTSGIALDGLRISDRAFVVLPTHKREDLAREAGEDSIGTTGRGIGPCYRDKVGRNGIRVGDFLEPGIEGKLKRKGLSSDEIADQLRMFDSLRPYVCDTVTLLHESHRAGKSILLEGAQGAMLDIDFGTYPYVTSSSPSTAGGCLGTGLPPTSIRKVIGVMKAYTTRVGRGPFPTELDDELGSRVRTQGHEFGTTTGRPRRCGWLDLVQLRYAIRILGVTDLAVMKLDVLSGIDPIRAGTAYRDGGNLLAGYPSRATTLERVTVDYDSFAGWHETIDGGSRLGDLPQKARTYIDYMEKCLETPVRYVSTSPDRKDTIVISA